MPSVSYRTQIRFSVETAQIRANYFVVKQCFPDRKASSETLNMFNIVVLVGTYKAIPWDSSRLLLTDCNLCRK